MTQEDDGETGAIADAIIRAQAVGWAAEKVTFGDEQYRYAGLLLNVPRGRSSQRIRLVGDISNLLKFQFEDWRLAENYEAVFNATTGLIEARLSHSHAFEGRSLRSEPDSSKIWELPEVLWDSDIKEGPGVEEHLESFRRYEIPTGWMLRVEDSSTTIELSPASMEYSTLLGRGFTGGRGASEVTLKVQHNQGPDGPNANRLLEQDAQDFLFELELSHRFRIHLTRRIPDASPTDTPAPEPGITYPRNRYSPEAHSLFWYATSARGLPLLQFLAYYQVIEHFFSPLARQAVTRQIRNHLRHPAFRIGSDDDISKLIDYTSDAHRGSTGELQQLTTAIHTCISEEDLREFVGSEPSRLQHFTERKQAVTGITRLQLDSTDPPLSDQIAQRIYSIRNRIVHAKQDASQPAAISLLPSSLEALALAAEIELVRKIAESAMLFCAALRD